MIITLYILGGLLFANGVYLIIKYCVVFSMLKRQQSASSSDRKFFFVLTPVFHEEKIIEDFLKDISLQNFPSNFLKVYIITTEKEYLNKVRPNTIDILNHLKAGQKISEPRFNFIHCPRIDGFKVDQLEYAFQEIRTIYGEAVISNAYFLLLDADSSLSPNTILNYNNAIEESIEVYLQPLLWFKNIKNLKDPLMQSFAFQQSFFSVAYEIPMLEERFFPWRLKYFVGHGLCLRGSFLLKMGGFPSIIEDVRLGRISSFLDIKAKIVPGFGIVETAKNFFIYIKQSSVWFFGCGLFLSDYAHSVSLREDKIMKMRDMILLLYGVFKAFRWLNKGILHLIGIMFAIIYSFPLLLGIFLTSLFINSSVPVLLVSKDFKSIWDKQLTSQEGLRKFFNAIVFAPILYAFNFIGLYYGLFKIIKFYLWGKVTLPKTDR